MKPILKYPGAKWRLSSWVIQHMPPHESYLEPYFGSGAVLFNKQPARIETINDIDGEVVNFFRMCREYPDELAGAIALTPWAREERDAAYCLDEELSDLERARRFAIKCWMTFGAFPHKSNGWRHTTGKMRDGGPDNPKLWARVPGCIAEAAERLMQVQIENRPAVEVIQRHNGPEVLIYADPPYVKQTRTASGNAYNHEMTDDDHITLLQALNKHNGSVLLSGYDCELYQDILVGWRCELKSTTAERGVRRTECLWIKDRNS